MPSFPAIGDPEAYAPLVAGLLEKSKRFRFGKAQQFASMKGNITSIGTG
jgi:hypothetical protein